VNDWGWKFTVTVEIDEVDLGTMSLHEMTSSYNYALSSLKEGYGAQSYPTQEEITRYDFAGAAAGETVEGGGEGKDGGGDSGGLVDAIEKAAADLNELGEVVLDGGGDDKAGTVVGVDVVKGAEPITPESPVAFKTEAITTCLRAPSLNPLSPSNMASAFVCNIRPNTVVTAIGEDANWLLIQLPSNAEFALSRKGASVEPVKEERASSGSGAGGVPQFNFTPAKGSFDFGFGASGAGEAGDAGGSAEGKPAAAAAEPAEPAEPTTGWVMRRTADIEHLVLIGAAADETNSSPGSGSGSGSGSNSSQSAVGGTDEPFVLDEELVSKLFGSDGPGGGGESSEGKEGDAVHPVMRVADSDKEEATSDITEMFGFIASSSMKSQLDTLGSFSCSVSHLVSIRYAQMALTAMIPLMSLEAQFDMDTVQDMIEFLRIVFLQQKDSFNSAPLQIIKKKVTDMIKGEGGGSKEAARKLCVHSLNVLRGKMMVDEVSTAPHVANNLDSELH
jgi:hypothetical protein